MNLDKSIISKRGIQQNSRIEQVLQILMIWLLSGLNTYQAMGRFSRRQTDDIFLIFPRHFACLVKTAADDILKYFLFFLENMI